MHMCSNAGYLSKPCLELYVQQLNGPVKQCTCKLEVLQAKKQAKKSAYKLH